MVAKRVRFPLYLQIKFKDMYVEVVFKSGIKGVILESEYKANKDKNYILGLASDVEKAHKEREEEERKHKQEIIRLALEKEEEEKHKLENEIKGEMNPENKESEKMANPEQDNKMIDPIKENKKAGRKKKDAN